MKTLERTIEVESTMQGEKIGLSINAEDMAHILSILTDLYEDRIMAIIREYSTNARDAMIEAGKADEPIHVTLPTALNPFLTIKDFGLGLNADDIRRVYSKYGASTKRESNDVQGMLGIGGKSALTYGDQFTVSAVKDGIHVEISVSRDEKGGHMELVDEFETDEPNSVEIQIQAESGSYWQFEQKAAQFFRFWDEGTVLVNGEQPERIDGFWIDDDLLIIESAGEDAIVMGNVAYPLPDEYQDYYRGYSIIAFVPIGSVSFTPSRESLSLDNLTVKTIERVLASVKEKAAKTITKRVAEASSKPEAMTLFHKLSALFSRQFEVEATYGGKEIPSEMEAPADQSFLVVQATADKPRRSKGWNRLKAYHSNVWHSTLFVRGYDGADFSPYKRAKMDQFLAEKFGDNPPEYNNVVFTRVVPNHHWIDKGRIFNWQEIKEQKIVRENIKKRDGRVSGSYEGYVDGVFKSEILAQDIDTSKPILYAEKVYGYSHNALVIAQDANPNGLTFLEIGSNRVNKLKRDFPSAQFLNDYVKDLAQQWADTLTEDDKLHLLIVNDCDYNDYSNLRDLTVEDPDLMFALGHYFHQNNSLVKQHNKFNGYIDISKDVEWKDPLAKYPLLTEMRYYGTMGSEMRKHVTLYLNAVYAAGQEEA